MKMSDDEYIRSSVKEAELYRSQGLLDESREKYLKILNFIQNSPKFRNHTKLIEGVKNKIRVLEKDSAANKGETVAPTLSEEVQHLIKRLFSFSKDKNARAIEGAVALAKFGQHDLALAEFRRLLEERAAPVVAAKNIIRCHLARMSPDVAIEEFGQWLSGDLLSKKELKNIRVFLVSVLEKQGMESEVPEVMEGLSEGPESGEKQEDIIDICSVRLRFERAPGTGKTLEFDVTFQSGNVISLIVSAKQKDLVENLSVGIRLPDMEFYSPIAIFRGSGVISGKTQIRSGPEKGAYMLDIRLDSV
jgi:tetratricopeptide (TPR) repeat protein